MLQIYDKIHDKVINGITHRFDSQATFRDPDGITIHGVITFTAEAI